MQLTIFNIVLMTFCTVVYWKLNKPIVFTATFISLVLSLVSFVRELMIRNGEKHETLEDA